MFPLTPDQHHWLEVATEDEGWCSFTSRARTLTHTYKLPHKIHFDVLTTVKFMSTQCWQFSQATRWLCHILSSSGFMFLDVVLHCQMLLLRFTVDEKSEQSKLWSVIFRVNNHDSENNTATTISTNTLVIETMRWRMRMMMMMIWQCQHGWRDDTDWHLAQSQHIIRPVFRLRAVALWHL